LTPFAKKGKAREYKEYNDLLQGVGFANNPFFID